jgi:hypothetical protein
MAPPPRAMTHGNKIWVQMKHKYYSTRIKQNKCIRKNIFNEKYEKCLIWVVFGHPPRGIDPTLTIFDGWRDLNPPNVYTKYENNPFKIVVCSLRKPNSFRRWRRRQRTGPKPKYPRLRPGTQ